MPKPDNASSRMKRYRTAIILGAGESGVAAARLLRNEGTEVTMVDAAATPLQAQDASRMGRLGIRLLTGTSELPHDDFELCVASPGVPVTSAWIAEMTRRGVDVVSELELGWSRCGARTVAVTGSNGKSTIVKWLTETLATAGLDGVAAGNGGPAVCEVALEERKPDWLVLEVSSFQLETVRGFRPEVGVLLNCHPNHLDRHGSMADYLAVKARLFARSEAADTCVVPLTLEQPVRESAGGRGRYVTFGLSPGPDYAYREGRVERRGAPVADLGSTLFDNEILGPSAAALVAAVEACGMEPSHAVAAARNFTPLPHRMEEVTSVGGIRFINDSKATNLAALSAALRMVTGRVRLIAGGIAKESGFGAVKEVLADKAAGVYLIGNAAGEMLRAWSGSVPCRSCGTLEQAVHLAFEEALPGEFVLLSPGCASFDQFRSFEERGDEFRRCVQLLVDEHRPCMRN